MIHGALSEPNSWPWMVSLRGRADNVHFCGATIIDEAYVITAAHCLYDGAGDVISTQAIKVVAGDHVINRVHELEKEYFPQRFHIHEEFNRTILLDNDIALIELTESIEYNDVIAPVCLPTGPPPVGHRCATTGWGWTLGTGLRHHLNEVHPPILSNEVCGSPDYWGDKITPNMVCAGYQGTGICIGDSGGPLVCDNGLNTPYSLVGITSWVKEKCRNPDGTKPSVFTNVYNYLEWIQTTMNCTGYTRSDNGHCYKFVNNEMNYTQAEEHCQAEGGYLVEIGSQVEQYFLQGLVSGNVWIGLQDHTGNWSQWNS